MSTEVVTPTTPTTARSPALEAPHPLLPTPYPHNYRLRSPAMGFLASGVGVLGLDVGKGAHRGNRLTLSAK